jgi:hypothetical protein
MTGYPAFSRFSTICCTSVLVSSKTTRAVASLLLIATFSTPSVDVRIEPILCMTAGHELHAGTLRMTVFSSAMAWLAANTNNMRLDNSTHANIFFLFM